MFLLPIVLPDAPELIRDLVDALSLAALSAPFIWLLIARPLRNAALIEMNRTKTVMETIVDAVINFDRTGRIESLNPAAEKLFGITSGEIVGQNISQLLPGITPDTRSANVSVGDIEPCEGLRKDAETVVCQSGKGCFPVEISVSPSHLQGQLSYVAIIHNITKRKQMEAAISEQKEFLENLVQNSVVPTFVMSPDRRILMWNSACEELTGAKASTMIGRDEPWKVLFDHKRPVLAEMVMDGPIEPPKYYSSFGKSMGISEGLTAEQWYKNLNGRDRYLLLNAAPIRNSKGELLAVIQTLQDITERKQYEEQLEYQVNHDQLTGLPNRNLLADRIRQTLFVAQRNHNQVAVIIIDLNQFKFINDNLGHDSGDEALMVIAERLTSCMRAGDTVARQGGDEFVIIISNPTAADSAALVAEKIQKALALPFSINEHELIITCSMGISVFPKDGEDALTLMKNADVAMYRAKEMGRNNFQFFAEEMNARSLMRMTMEKHLRRALDRNELSLHYQPKVSLLSGHITGMEALLRWNSPELGMVSPASFIPLAEETGLIEQIGEWVLRTACAQNKAWQNAGLTAMTVAINLSVRQFRQTNIASVIGQILRDTGLDPRFLELEITESLILQNSDSVITILNELKGMGISLTMDDFGTGYSSLSYLKRFPFDKIKIDQAFVRDITSNPNSAAIAKTVIAMAHGLHLKVIAEGVETEGQLQYLRDNNCDEIQGYFFSRPIPAGNFEELLRSGSSLNIGEEKTYSGRKTILVVDDEPAVTSMFEKLLSLDGYHVLTAGNAAEGFDQLAINPVSVVISDQRMPGISGIEFLSRVKALYPEVVRIIVTGYADIGSITEAINQGAVYKFIMKPWKYDFVRTIIGEAFEYNEYLNGKIESSKQ
jgi:diguanylate cyclase (GGDEF)-like protein/PAS domain S-box-containing protein